MQKKIDLRKFILFLKAYLTYLPNIQLVQKKNHKKESLAYEKN